MDSETVESFAKYRLNKAKETLETAEMILKEGKDLTSANNRAYYAIFYYRRSGSRHPVFQNKILS